MARPGISPFGRMSAPPACASRAVKRFAPTLSSTATAGALGDTRHPRPPPPGALKGKIEILGRVAAVSDRTVVEQRLGMNEPILKAQSINERLERRAGRAQRLGHVDLTGSPLVEVARGRDARQHLPACIVDGQ